MGTRSMHDADLCRRRFLGKAGDAATAATLGRQH
jgi:hypothetical protein